MRSIFFPFEQMVNYIDYQRARHRFIVVLFMVIISGLFYIFNFWLALVFLAISIIVIMGMRMYILIKTKKAKNEKKPKDRETGGVFFVFVIVFLAIIFDFTTKYYNEDLDITSYWSWWPIRAHDTVNIYSGEPDGNYYKMMYKVTRYDPSNFKAGRIGSSGGYENPNRVMLDPQGLSFVKEEIYKDDDKIREQIDYAAPLYIEKLHIVYNKKSLPFKNLLAYDTTNYLSLGFNDDSLIGAIRKCRIAVGKPGSSTKILSSIVLTEISKKKPAIDVFSIKNASLREALSGIRNGKFDIIFFIAGQPVDAINILLNVKDSFGLIGIEPSFVDAINKTHDTKYRYTDFSVKKDPTESLNNELSYGSQYERLPTLGSICYLIVNKKLQPYLIKKFNSDLEKVKNSLNIDFLNFEDNYDREYQKKKNKTVASLLLAFTGGVALGTVILSFIFALISSFWHDKIGNKLAAVINDIPDDSIPEEGKEFEAKKEEDRDSYEESLSKLSDEGRNEKIKIFELYYESIKGKFDIKTPHINFYQIGLIDKKVVGGMSRLVDLRQEINKALNHGKLNSEHFNNLLVRIDTIMDKLRKSLFLRLHEIFNREPRFNRLDINDKQIKKLLITYVTSSYLNFDDYKKLINDQ